MRETEVCWTQNISDSELQYSERVREDEMAKKKSRKHVQLTNIVKFTLEIFGANHTFLGLNVKTWLHCTDDGGKEHL
jgi:hypothetical protein